MRFLSSRCQSTRLRILVIVAMIIASCILFTMFLLASSTFSSSFFFSFHSFDDDLNDDDDAGDGEHSQEKTAVGPTVENESSSHHHHDNLTVSAAKKLEHAVKHVHRQKARYYYAKGHRKRPPPPPPSSSKHHPCSTKTVQHHQHQQQRHAQNRTEVSHHQKILPERTLAVTSTPTTTTTTTNTVAPPPKSATESPPPPKSTTTATTTTSTSSSAPQLPTKKPGIARRSRSNSKKKPSHAAVLSSRPDIGLIVPTLDVEFDLHGDAVDPKTKTRIVSSNETPTTTENQLLTANILLPFIQQTLFDPSELTLSTYKVKIQEYHNKSLSKFFTPNAVKATDDIWGRWRPTACLDHSTLKCDYLSSNSDGRIPAHDEWFNDREEFPNHCCVVASQGRWSKSISPTLFDDMRKMMMQTNGDEKFSFFEIFRSRIAKPLLEFIPIRRQRRKYWPGSVNDDVDFIGNRYLLKGDDPVEKLLETTLEKFVNPNTTPEEQRTIFSDLFSGFGRTEKTRTEFTEKFNDLMFGFLGSRELPLYQAKLMLLLSLSTMKKVDIPVLLPKSKTPHRPSAWTINAKRSAFEEKPTMQPVRRLLLHGNSHLRALMSSFVAIMRQLPFYYDRSHQGISRYVITNYGDYFLFDTKDFMAYGTFYGDSFFDDNNSANKTTKFLKGPLRLSHPDEVVLVDVVVSFYSCTEFHESIEPIIKAFFAKRPPENETERIGNITMFRKNPINYDEKMAVIDGTKKYPRYGGKFTTSVNPNAQRPLIHDRKNLFGGADFSALLYRPMMVRQIARVEKDFGLELINEYAQYTVENFLNYDYQSSEIKSPDHGEEERFASVISHAYQQYHINRKKITDRSEIKRSDEVMDIYENIYWRNFFLHNHYNNSGGSNPSSDDDSFTEEERREKERLKKLTKRRVFIPPALPSEDFQSVDGISHTSCIALYQYPAKLSMLKSVMFNFRGLCEDEPSRAIWFKYGLGAFLSSSVFSASFSITREKK